MNPLDRLQQYFQERKADILHAEQYREYAVFVPVIRRAGEDHFLFEVRSSHVPQPGEICFPGGKVDSTDPSPAAAGIRELAEETGVLPSQITYYGELDYMITPMRSIIYPFFGRIDEEAAIQPNEQEVAEVFTVPVSHLLATAPETHPVHIAVEPSEDFPYHLIPKGRQYPWGKGSVQEHFYQYRQYTIWGLTARILTHTLDELKKADPLKKMI
ncbi:NUDIX domain-containing protein [Alkalicoccus luteus]|uniref:CoA pyrophosphatase n=1 Tax=Alkalicoccus luteus TaxID=1237094 RepID=A0A969PQF8_9BACI|nr:CoA pyrophosphatase [Alkalicoccus luteus]